MGTIAENLLALQETKEKFKTAFAEKEVDLTDVPFTEYPNKFSEIKTSEDLDTELTEQETLLTDLEADVNALSDKDDTALKILDGTLEEFDNTKIGATSLMTNRFNGFTNLKSANFKGITNIPSYTCHECSSLENLVLDEETTNIGSYAFYRCHMKDFVLHSKNFCKLGSYAFTDSYIVGVVGEIGSIGGSCFDSTKLTNIDIKIKGDVGTYAFRGATLVNNLKISKDSVIYKLDSYCFHTVGADRPNPETKVFDLDFLNSTFTTIGNYAFGNSVAHTINKYYNIKFPKSLTTINSYAFRYSDHMNLYFTSLTPASLNSNSFNNATNLKICVPYNVVNAYKTATNWVTHADKIVGYSDKDSFKQGQKLPQYSAEGFNLTWYSDADLTQQVTTADNPSEYYYCAISGEAVDVVKLTIYEDGCDIKVIDALTNTEYVTLSYVPVGTQLTISINPTTDGYIPYISTFNGEEFVSTLNYTTITGIDMNLIGVYYNGIDIPVSPTLSQNSWSLIKSVIQAGNASKYWSIGDIKEIEIGNVTYGVRLSDMRLGRYDYADGTRKTNAVFEFVQLYDTKYEIGTTLGWDNSKLRTTLNTTILDNFPIELKNLLEEVIVKSANGCGKNYSGISESSNMLFIPCAEEVGLNLGTNLIHGEGTIWDYYNALADNEKIKYLNNTTSDWWTRSPSYANDLAYNYVNTSGTSSTSFSSSKHGVCPCFAW